MRSSITSCKRFLFCTQPVTPAPLPAPGCIAHAPPVPLPCSVAAGSRDLRSKRAKPSSVAPRKGGSGDKCYTLTYEADCRQVAGRPAGGGDGHGEAGGEEAGERGAHLRGLDGVFTWICRRGQWRRARSALGHPASALVPGS